MSLMKCEALMNSSPFLLAAFYGALHKNKERDEVSELQNSKKRSFLTQKRLFLTLRESNK
jgi:hypothetical protein